MTQTSHGKLFTSYSKLSKRKMKSTAVSMSALARVKSVVERVCDLVNL